MGSGDDRAKVLAGFVDPPPHCVVLVTDLHGVLVLMPTADSPDVIIGRQLVLKVRSVDAVAVAGPLLADEDHLQRSVGHGVHFMVEGGVVRYCSNTGHAGLQDRGIASIDIRAAFVPAVVVMIAD